MAAQIYHIEDLEELGQLLYLCLPGFCEKPYGIELNPKAWPVKVNGISGDCKRWLKVTAYTYIHRPVLKVVSIHAAEFCFAGRPVHD